MTTTQNHKFNSQQWLDRLLEQQPAEVKDEILEFIAQFEDASRPNSEILVVLTAIGYLQTLAIDRSRDWENTLENFQTQLQLWEIRNLRTLELLSHEAETSEQIGKTFQELTNILNELVPVSAKLMSTWQKSDPKLESSLNIFSKSLQSLNVEIQSLKKNQTLSPNIPDEQAKVSGIDRSKKEISFKPFYLLSFLICGFLAFTGLGAALGFLFYNQQQNAEVLSWLLYKANRQECLSGVKPKDSRECQSLLGKK